VTKAPTAEELQKQDITLRWVELINAVASVERKTACGGEVAAAMEYFIEKFYAFFYATQFYIEEELVKKVENVFANLEKRKRFDPLAVLHVAKEYSRACYTKGMFIEEETVAEEGW